jgi:hypothetical protein
MLIGYKPVDSVRPYRTVPAGVILAPLRVRYDADTLAEHDVACICTGVDSESPSTFWSRELYNR